MQRSCKDPAKKLLARRIPPNDLKSNRASPLWGCRRVRTQIPRTLPTPGGDKEEDGEVRCEEVTGAEEMSETGGLPLLSLFLWKMGRQRLPVRRGLRSLVQCKPEKFTGSADACFPIFQCLRVMSNALIPSENYCTFPPSLPNSRE